MTLTGARWRKSTHSNPYGSCVEVGEDYRTSSYSGDGNSCVEVASGILVRDTTYARRGEVSPVLRFTPAAWREFAARLRA